MPRLYLDTADIITILAQLQPVAAMLEQMRTTLPDVDGDQLMQVFRESDDLTLAQRCPGLFMQNVLRNGRRRNVDRNSKRSDLVDIQHVQYLPYVDIFTTDRENVAVLAPMHSKAARSARVFSSGMVPSARTRRGSAS